MRNLIACTFYLFCKQRRVYFPKQLEWILSLLFVSELSIDCHRYCNSLLVLQCKANSNISVYNIRGKKNKKTTHNHFQM